MKTIDFSYYIERYNAGEMSEAEQQWFQKELNGNEKLQAEVNLRKTTDKVLKNQDNISLREKLAKIEKSRISNIEIRRSKNSVYLKYVAVFAGLFIAGSVAFFSGKNLSNEEIINRYYKAYETPTAQRSDMAEINAYFTQAIVFYNTQDYNKAAVLFSKILENNPEDMQSELLYGVSNFENKKYPEAKQSFSKVIFDDNNLFIETAKWYLALCYVKTNDKNKAIQQLEVITEEGGIYKNNAKNIIKKLK